MAVAIRCALLGVFFAAFHAAPVSADDYSIVDTGTLIRVQHTQVDAYSPVSKSRTADDFVRDASTDSDEVVVAPRGKESSKLLLGALAAVFMVGVGIAAAGIFFSGSRSMTRQRR